MAKNFFNRDIDYSFARRNIMFMQLNNNLFEPNVLLVQIH